MILWLPLIICSSLKNRSDVSLLALQVLGSLHTSHLPQILSDTEHLTIREENAIRAAFWLHPKHWNISD